MKQEDIIEQVQTNYIGSINVTKAGISYLKKQREVLFYLLQFLYKRAGNV